MCRTPFWAFLTARRKFPQHQSQHDLRDRLHLAPSPAAERQLVRLIPR